MSVLRKPRITDEQKARVLALFDGEKTVYEIAQEAGVRITQAGYALRENGKSRVYRKLVPLASGSEEEVLKAYADGRAVRSIASAHCVSPVTVRKLLVAYGVLTRARCYGADSTERRKAMRVLYALGWSYESLGSAWGLSHEGASNIVDPSTIGER